MWTRVGGVWPSEGVECGPGWVESGCSEGAECGLGWVESGMATHSMEEDGTGYGVDDCISVVIAR